MNDRIISIISGGTGLVIGFLFLVWWFGFNPTKDIIYDVPGRDGRPENYSTETGGILFGTHHISYDKTIAISTHDETSWPRFRGVNFDNISPVDLKEEWDYKPDILWKITLGEGHAGPAVLNGRVYVMDYDEVNKRDLIRCYALEDGRELWQTGYTVQIKRNHGISRTVPAVTDDYVVTIGPLCQVMCVDARTGSFKWGIDLSAEYGTKAPLWYTAQCPLIDENVAVIAPGGSALIMGVDCETGEVLWETPNPGGWEISHSSVMPMELGGKKIYVYAALGGIVGVSAEKGEEGTVLWKDNQWSVNVVAPAPVIFEDGHIFITSGYGAGSLMLKVNHEEGEYKTEVIYRHSPKEGLACEQQTPILYKDHLFGILPKDAGTNRNQFICYNPAGDIVWTSGKTNQYGLGPFILIDDKFFILNDDGELTIARASLEKFEFLGKYKILDGIDAWGPLAVSGNRLLLRDKTEMVNISLE